MVKRFAIVTVVLCAIGIVFNLFVLVPALAAFGIGLAGQGLVALGIGFGVGHFGYKVLLQKRFREHLCNKWALERDV